MGGGLCELAETMGYSADLCSYARSDIACATVNGGPIGGLPKPDMLVVAIIFAARSSNGMKFRRDILTCLYSFLDTPFCHTAYTEEAAKYIRAQFDEYIEFLENVCKRKFDYERLKKSRHLSHQGQLLWQAILDTATNKPAPMSAFDAFYHLALIVTSEVLRRLLTITRSFWLL